MSAVPQGAAQGLDDYPSLREIVEDFQALEEPTRLQLLLEFSEDLPAPPARYGENPESMEQVVECQSPLFLAVEWQDGKVLVHFSAPPSAPTTRGFAGILKAGLDGLTAAEVLAVPEDLPDRLGLKRAVSPLRLRGMGAMLTRIKRAVGKLPAAHAATG